MAPSKRIIDLDFSGGIPPWALNAETAEPGYGGSPYAMAPTDSESVFGLTIPNVLAYTNYSMEAWLKGTGTIPETVGADAVDSETWVFRDWMWRIPVGQASLGSTRGAMFQGDMQVGTLLVEQLTTTERAEYSDNILSGYSADMPAISGTVDSRMANLPNALTTLRTGGTLKIACVGDSLMNDTTFGSFPELLARSYPLSTPQMESYTLGGTGATGWLAADKSAIYTFAPDVIYFGGLSSDYIEGERSDWNDLIAAFQANIPGVEIVLGSATRLKPTSSAFVASVATANGVGFYDAYRAWVDWLAASGVVEATMLRDGLHLTDDGKEVAARGIAWWFGASKP